MKLRGNNKKLTKESCVETRTSTLTRAWVLDYSLLSAHSKWHNCCWMATAEIKLQGPGMKLSGINACLENTRLWVWFPVTSHPAPKKKRNKTIGLLKLRETKFGRDRKETLVISLERLKGWAENKGVNWKQPQLL